MAGMATNDTDPQRTEPYGDDASRTEPGAPPVASTPDDASSAAASLLAGLAESAQPIQDVAETKGHVAAAYAAAPHRPPRPNDKTIENPAVYINATVPLNPDPPSSSRQRLGPPAAPFVSMNGAPTVPGGARLLESIERNETTEPGERVKNQMRVVLACIAGVVVAGLIAIGILALVQRRPPEIAPSPAVVVPSASVMAPSAVAPQPIVETAPTSTATTPSSRSASSPPTLTTKPSAPVRSQGSSTTPTPRPSGTFAEPDRHL